MARKKAHRQHQTAAQQQSALVPTLSLDELLARAQTADKGYVKAYLDAGGSPTMMVSVTASNTDRTKLVVPLLHAMCMCNHKNHKDLKGSLELMVKAGVDINSTCTSLLNNSRTALTFACEMMQCCVLPLEALLAAGANPNIASPTDGMTALHITCFRANLNAAQLLLSHGADPVAKNYMGFNARYQAAVGGNVELLQLVMNCSSGTAPPGCCPPLHGAVANDRLQCVKWLLKHGEEVDSLDSELLTPLHCATVFPDRDNIIKVLLQYSANVHALTTRGEEPLDLLVDKASSLAAARMLIAAGANAAHICYNGRGAIHKAIQHGNTELVQLLLENGASTVINTAVMECHRDCGKVTPLMASTVIPITKLLLAAGADVHAVTSNGDTCLHIAAKHKYPAPLLCLLLQAGANISAKNRQGRTAAQIAMVNGNTLMEALLKRAAQR
jgi:ankyrin repeat protein